MGFDRNGWYPRLAKVDGRLFMAYGNGQTRLAELRKNGSQIEVVKDIQLWSPLPEFPSIWGAQWGRDGQLFAFVETGSRPDRAVLCSTNVRDPLWRFSPHGDDPELVAGNIHAITPDLWSSWLAAKMRLVINGQPYPGGGVLAASGKWVTHSKDGENSAIIRRHLDRVLDSEEHPRVPPNYHQAAIAENGWTIYGGYGATHGFRQAGVDEALTVVPWGVEGIGLCWVGSDQKVWVATMGWNDNLPTVLVLIRPWGEQACVIVERDAVDLSIIEDGDDWVMASCDAVGILNVDVVSRASARRTVEMPAVRIKVPEFLPFEHPVLFHVSDEPKPAARWTWFEEAPQEGQPDRRDPNPREENVQGVFHTIGTPGQTKSREMARALRVPLVRYNDQPGYPDPIDGTVSQLFGYPVIKDGTLEPVADSIRRLRNDIKRLRDGRPRHRIGLTIALYCQIKGDLQTYNWPLQHVIDLAHACWDLAREEAVDVVWAYVYDRASGRDGVIGWRQLIEVYNRMYAAYGQSPKLSLRGFVDETEAPATERPTEKPTEKPTTPPETPETTPKPQEPVDEVKAPWHQILKDRE